MSCHGFICLWQASPYNSIGIREKRRNGEREKRGSGGWETLKTGGSSPVK